MNSSLLMDSGHASASHGDSLNYLTVDVISVHLVEEALTLSFTNHDKKPIPLGLV